MAAFRPEIRNREPRVTRDQLFRREIFPRPSLAASSRAFRTSWRDGMTEREHSIRNLEKKINFFVRIFFNVAPLMSNFTNDTQILYNTWIYTGGH